MEKLERIWEYIALFFNSILGGFEKGIRALFGSSNARYIKKLESSVQAINDLEPKYEAMTDEELRAQTDIFRKRLVDGETTDDILFEAFAVCREGGRRFLAMRHYDVQLVGGMVLHSGSIAEMVTGEGKTLVATLPAYLNALTGKGVHVVTVNDYLARRDMEWMAPLYMGLGLTVGAIQSNMDVDTRQKAYNCDITYGTNNEFGFDYLRDNMRPAARGDDRYPKRMQQSQGRLTYAIIDEVDNILVDEARTPLIISGPAHDDISKYAQADKIARQLKRDKHFEINEKDHHVHLTDAGVREAEKLAGVESFYTAGNMEWPHLIDNSLKAHFLYKRDVNYVIKDGAIVIVDEFTGRLMEGRQWSDGLHQAVEAREGVKIKEETQTLATITLQNFFKLYDKICGMTGTAMTEAGEFWKIYQLDVIAIPTNRPLERIAHPDVIYRSVDEKYEAMAEEIEKLNRWDVVITEDGNEHWGEIVEEENDGEILVFEPKSAKDRKRLDTGKLRSVKRRGRPVLVGTVSIEKSERLSDLLTRRGIHHEVLNAKHHKREAEIVAQAGRLGAVTIATNMAGRGTDIVLGGNPETMAWARLQDKYPTRLEVPREEWDGLVKEIDIQEGMSVQGETVVDIGGLHVIGTERHEARRIDLQLCGRCGRQGDPGSSRFFLSLEDDLMRIFAGEWVKNILTRLGMKEGEAIESRMVTKRVEAAQKKVEERNFEIRKNLLEYDEVMDEQRKRVYSYRQDVLEGAECKALILDMIRYEIDRFVEQFMARDFGVETYAKWVGSQLSVQFEARDFRGMDARSAQQYALDEAEHNAETVVLDAIEENLPIEEEPASWNWSALTKTLNVRWGLNLQDRQLKQEGRDSVDTFLVEQGREAIKRINLDEGARFLDADFALNSFRSWMEFKFSIEIPLDEIKTLEKDELKELAYEKAHLKYDDKEAEYPVMAGFYRYSAPTREGMPGKIDREGLITWAGVRFAGNIAMEDVRNCQRDEIREKLMQLSHNDMTKGEKIFQAVDEKVNDIFEKRPDLRARDVASNGQLGGVVDWVKQTCHRNITTEDLELLHADQMRRRLLHEVEERYRPEMRRMERAVLLEMLDSAWKEHLLAMDYLRSAVGMRGYAQVDPKVEYKREGMRQFEAMWDSINERTTDLIFRMENLNEDFVGSTWVGTSETHDDAQSQTDIAQQQQQAIDASQNKEKIEPIRRQGQQVGRNDPCPCGSGKKFKKCCMRRSA